MDTFSSGHILAQRSAVKLLKMIDWFCITYSLEKPRTYRKVAHKDFLAFAKSKKPSQRHHMKRLEVLLSVSYDHKDPRVIAKLVTEGRYISKRQIAGVVYR